MQSNWATENLQVIRTLMERSALYRRALAPIMLTVGLIGLVAGLVGYVLKIDSLQTFILFWVTTSIVCLIVSFLLVRRQAFKENEPFWSSPTRRVAQALAPALFVGLGLAALGFASVPANFSLPIFPWMLPVIWMILYGLALHAAGFFMMRGVRVLGWIFILCGVISFCEKLFLPGAQTLLRGHMCMGGVFGGLHLACGIYLHFTEKKNPIA